MIEAWAFDALHVVVNRALRSHTGDAGKITDDIIAALTAAGWTLAPPGSRVVPEGAVDAETVGTCLGVVSQHADARAVRSSLYDKESPWRDRLERDQTVLEELAADLRALAEAKP